MMNEHYFELLFCFLVQLQDFLHVFFFQDFYFGFLFENLFTLKTRFFSSSLNFAKIYALIFSEIYNLI